MNLTNLLPYVEYIVFGVIVLACLILDLKLHKEDKPISVKNAAIWSAIWIALALAFGGYIWRGHGAEDAMKYLTGYFLEKSLSVDNLFVFIAIFTSFAILPKYQHRVLYFGIIGAIIMRFIFIAAGTAILSLGERVLAVFGIFILWTAYKMFIELRKEEKTATDYSQHRATKIVRKFFPVTNELHGHDFFVKMEPTGRNEKKQEETGRNRNIESNSQTRKPANPQTNTNSQTSAVWHVTPLFLCLVMIELADVMFAFDSVPAVIAVTQDPFLVYTSNIFAILGLRSLYFLLVAAKKGLKYLDIAVVVLLVYIGIKMLIVMLGVHIPPVVNLLVIGGVLGGAIVLSLVGKKK